MRRSPALPLCSRSLRVTQVPEAAHHRAAEDPAQQQSAIPRREEGAAAAVASVRRRRGRDMVDGDQHCSQRQRAGAPELHGQQRCVPCPRPCPVALTPPCHRRPCSLHPRLLQRARHPALLGHGPRRKRVCRAARLLLARAEQVRRWSRPGHRAAHGAAAATRACSRYQCPTLTITTTAPHLAH